MQVYKRASVQACKRASIPGDRMGEEGPATAASPGAGGESEVADSREFSWEVRSQEGHNGT